MTLRSALLLLLALALPFGLAACDANNESGSATVRVLLTDGPIDEADSANVTIERVELIGDGGTVVLLDSLMDFNLLDLRDGVTAELADSLIIGAAEYSQLRFIVSDDAELVMNDGTVYDLRVPSGPQTGIKLNLPPIEVDEENETVEVTVDFDVEESFVVIGPENDPNRFQFKPVLKIADLIINGDAVPEDEIPPPDEIEEGGA